MRNKDFGFLASEGPDGRTFSSLRSFSIERRPTRYDLHVSILQERFVVHLLFSLSWNVSPGFGSEKLGWFGVRGGWPPQYATSHTSCKPPRFTWETHLRRARAALFDEGGKLWYADDGKAATLANAKIKHEIQSNCYVLYLARI